MSRKRHAYTKPLFLTKAGAGAENLDDDIVAGGKHVVLMSIACEDETSALTYLRIGKVSAGKFFVWAEKKTPAAGEVIHEAEERHLREGEHFRAVFSGGALSDKCVVYLDGYWMPEEEV